MAAGPFPLAVGDRARFHKTVGEADITLFAGLSGDFARNHVDETYMAAGPGGRIAHGALLVAYMSAASTRLSDRLPEDPDWLPVSLGYDRIRFLKPVRIGDTLTVDYAVSAVEPERRRATASIEILNQRGERVAVASHILVLVARRDLASSAG